MVSEATLVTDEACYNEIYDHYKRAEAWAVAPGAQAALASVRSAGESAPGVVIGVRVHPP